LPFAVDFAGDTSRPEGLGDNQRASSRLRVWEIGRAPAAGLNPGDKENNRRASSRLKAGVDLDGDIAVPVGVRGNQGRKNNQGVGAECRISDRPGGTVPRVRYLDFIFGWGSELSLPLCCCCG